MLPAMMRDASCRDCPLVAWMPTGKMCASKEDAACTCAAAVHRSGPYGPAQLRAERAHRVGILGHLLPGHGPPGAGAEQGWVRAAASLLLLHLLPESTCVLTWLVCPGSNDSCCEAAMVCALPAAWKLKWGQNRAPHALPAALYTACRSCCAAVAAGSTTFAEANQADIARRSRGWTGITAIGKGAASLVTNFGTVRFL